MNYEKQITAAQQLMVSLAVLSPVLYSLGQIFVKSDRPADVAMVQRELPTRLPQLVWQDFSINGFQKALQTDRIVLVDFYAKWDSLTIINQSTIFRDPKVIQEVLDKNVITMRADWTYENPEIAAFLESYGYSGIPLLVLTSKSTMQDPLMLSGPLSAEGLLKAINQLK